METVVHWHIASQNHQGRQHQVGDESPFHPGEDARRFR